MTRSAESYSWLKFDYQLKPKRSEVTGLYMSPRLDERLGYGPTLWEVGLRTVKGA